MSAALKPRISAQSRPRNFREAADRVTVLANPARSQAGQPLTGLVELNRKALTEAPPRHLQAVPSTPTWSRRTQLLAAFNTGISMLTSLLVVTALGGYGYTVYVDRQLDESSAHLNSLQRNGQQLTTMSEVLKNYMAEQAERPSAGLQPPRPTNVIFLKPAQRRTSAGTEAPIPTEAKPASRLAPLGY
ncbi:MAG: hypothetical protein ICV62_00095 [Cyanobacteria bacterium Co-bin13]|nr:hypothetical protein [Cyanobacteria bacterium Co-bin13]